MNERGLFLERRDAHLAGRLVLRARSSGAADSADDLPALDEWDTAARCDHPIERHYVVEPVRLDGESTTATLKQPDTKVV